MTLPALQAESRLLTGPLEPDSNPYCDVVLAGVLGFFFGAERSDGSYGMASTTVPPEQVLQGWGDLTLRNPGAVVVVDRACLFR